MAVRLEQELHWKGQRKAVVGNSGGLFPPPTVKTTVGRQHCQVVRTGHNFQIMRISCLPGRAVLAFTLSLALGACQQVDQELPFELAPGEAVSLQIGAAGGIVSLPPSFSLDIPAGALGASTAVEVVPMIGEAFPSSAGVPVPGTAYDLQPEGTQLAVPALVEIAIPDAAIDEDDQVLATVGVRRPDGTVETFDGTYDLSSGIIRAEIDRLGPLSVVVNADAIAVASGVPPALAGGSVPLPPAPSPGGPAPADPQYGGVAFEAVCSADPSSRQCFSSGLIRVWADEVVRRRIGERLFLVSPDVTATLEFLDFVNGIPTSVIGSIAIDGALRSRFNATVDSYTMDEGVNTGPTTQPQATGLNISGNVMTFGETTNSTTGLPEINEDVVFAITGIGTSEMLVIEVEVEISFPTDGAPDEIGILTAHVRLRR